MNLDEYRDRMEASHQQFQTSVLEMFRAYGQTQTVFTDLLRNVETGFADLRQTNDELKESNEELRRMILDVSDQMRALRERLNGGGDR